MLKNTVPYLPALLFAALLLFPEKGIPVFPFRGDHHCRVDNYIDSSYTNIGSQGTLVATSDTAVIYEYESSQQDTTLAIKPVSGLEFRCNDTLDISRCRYLDLAIVMKVAFPVTVSMVTAEPLSAAASVPGRRYSAATITLQPHAGKYRLTFSKFIAPEWWKAQIGRTQLFALPNKNPDYSKVVAIRIQKDRWNSHPVPVRMAIKKIEFRKDRRMFVVCVLGGCVAWLLFVAAFSYRRFRHEKKNAALTQPIVPAKLANTVEDQKMRLVTYMGANYQMAELSVGKVSKETGIRIDRIPGLLQEKYGMNFKQYLNFVRINEAKRLLETTDENITQIAFAVGYNNIPNFNRVFKGLVGKNPTEYRDKDGKNKE